MSRAPRLTGEELVSALAKVGFQVIRIRGSHHFVRHDDGRRTVVPVHVAEIIGPGLLRKILRDCQMNIGQLEDLMRGP